MIRSGNPALKESTFLDLGSGAVVSRDAGAMSLNGTVNKTGILLLLSVLTAAFAWSQSLLMGANGVAEAVAPAATGYMLGGAIGGFILAMVTVFKKTWAPITAPLYALVEGFFLGCDLGGVRTAFRRHRLPGRAADLRHLVRPADGLPQRPDQGDRELQAGRGRGHRRHRPGLPGDHRAGLLRHQYPVDP